MADISLRDYLGKLDSLLNQGAPSEVVHHCRHILQYFPKNADTYRYLGRALMQSSSWEEAGEVFQRVLSVYPDDYTAHVGLSDVYLNLKRADDAIWHLERAFEQNPNNEAIIDGLRELYRKYRRVEQGKIQLTAGAVARQYIRNGLYEQAIETLQQSLERTPERADLRLLLAQTYQEAGYRVEAAEVALEVLNVLPDSLVANRILTELWLSESRPSDAQRYLNRIQSVDPYLALELAQGETVADDAFRLEELDYRRAAEREINTQSPDWLRDIGGNTEAQASTPASASDDAAWSGSFAASTAADDDDLPVFDDAFSSDLPDDWMTELPEEPAPPLPNLPSSKKTGRTGLLHRFDETPEEAEAEPDLESLFPSDNADDLFPVDAAAVSNEMPDLPDLFGEEIPSSEAPAATARQTGALKDSDPLAWLHESGIEIVDNPEMPGSDDLFGADEDNLALQDADAANPMAWLQGYSGDIINEDTDIESRSKLPTEQLPLAGDDDANPLAWLENSGVEIVEESAYTTPPRQRIEEPDPLDWLADESLLDEALDLEALIDAPNATEPPRSATPPVADWQDLMADEHDDSLDWFNAAKSEPEANEGQNAPRAESTSGEALPDWFAEMDNEPAESASDVPDWLSQMQPTDEPEPAQSGGSGMLDWLSQENTPAEPELAAPSADETSGFEWMSEAASEDIGAAETGVESMPDWLSQSAPTDEPVAEMPSADDSDFEWMSETVSEDIGAAETGVESMPDWLSQSAPTDEPVAEMPSADDSGFEWMSETVSEDIGAAETGIESMPDWLSQSAPTDEPIVETPVADDSGFEWMSETSSEEIPQAAEPIAEVPDWLSQLPAADEPEYEVEAPIASAQDDSGFEWISEATSDDEPIVEPAAEVPNWMAQLPSAAELEFAGTMDTSSNEAPEEFEGDELTLIEGIGPMAAEALQKGGITTFAQIASASPDDLYQIVTVEQGVSLVGDTETWPKQAQYLVDGDINGFYRYQEYLVGGREPVEETFSPENEIESPVAAAQDDSGFEWMSSVSESDESPEMEPKLETPVADDSGFSWMSEATSDADDELIAEPAADAPDWLSQISPAADDEPQAESELPAADDSGFEWVSEATSDVDDELIAEPAADAPDWLSQMSPATSDEPQAELETPVADDSGFEWVSEASSNEDAEPAADVPDWLSQMAPATSDEPQDESEVAVAADSGFDWMTELNSVDEDEEESITEIPTETPDWLSQSRPVIAQTVHLDDPDENFPWEDSLDEDNDETAEPSGEKPEWLSNIQSSQSQAVEEPAEQEMGEEFSWIDDINTPPSQEPVVAAASSTEFADDFNFDDSAEVSSDNDLFDDEIAESPTPASNAPDWLNAMVPGLDVDYDAPEDEPIEESFLENPADRAEELAPIQNKREFDWLVNIVEEETQQVAAIQDSGKQRRFVFSRPPAWLREPTESRDKPSSAPAVTSDDDDFDDVDLPPWLQ